jgi:hypothetical protein
MNTSGRLAIKRITNRSVQRRSVSSLDENTETPRINFETNHNDDFK